MNIYKYGNNTVDEWHISREYRRWLNSQRVSGDTRDWDFDEWYKTINTK